MQEYGHKERRSFYASNIALRYLQYFDVNMYFIMLPAIVIAFSESPHLVKLSTSVAFFSFGLSVFFSGVIVEHLHIRKTIFVSLTIFLIGCLVSLFSHNMILLNSGRFIQAFGLGFLPTIVRVIAGLVHQDKFSRAIMFQNMITAWAPVLAMLIAGYLVILAHWKSVFLLLMVYGVVLYLSLYFFLPSIYQERRDQKLLNWFLLYARLVKQKDYWLVVMASAMLSSSLAIYFIASVFIFSHTLNMPSHFVAWLSVSVFVAFSIGSLLGLNLLKLITKTNATITGLLVMFVGAVAMLLLALLLPVNVKDILIPMLIYMVGFGIASPAYVGKVCKIAKPISVAAGMALMGSLTALVNTINTSIMAHLHIRSALPLAIHLIILLLISISLSFIYLRGKKIKAIV